MFDEYDCFEDFEYVPVYCCDGVCRWFLAGGDLDALGDCCFGCLIPLDSDSCE